MRFPGEALCEWMVCKLKLHELHGESSSVQSRLEKSRMARIWIWAMVMPLKWGFVWGQFWQVETKRWISFTVSLRCLVDIQAVMSHKQLEWGAGSSERTELEIPTESPHWRQLRVQKWMTLPGEDRRRSGTQPWDIPTLRGQAEEVYNSYII